MKSIDGDAGGRIVRRSVAMVPTPLGGEASLTVKIIVNTPA